MIDTAAIVRDELRLHPRVAHQTLAGAPIVEAISRSLPTFIPFRGLPYLGMIAILDWDHRLPSRRLCLRVYAYTSADGLKRGEQSYAKRVEEIAQRDRFPEFDVPDFEGLYADEAYEGDVTPEGQLGRMRLTSPWRREFTEGQAHAAVELARRSDQFRRIREETAGRPSYLGDLEAVGWCPPCESGESTWCLDVWYLTAFDGHLGKGQSLLVSLELQKVLATREFSVRTA